MFFIKNFFSLFLILIIFNIKYSVAASQGRLGEVSIGDIDIDLVLEDRVNITNLNSIDLGLWSGQGDLNIYDDVCIYSSTGKYQITIYNNYASNQDFSLKNQDNDYKIPIKIGWSDKAYTNNGYTMAKHNISIKNQKNADREYFDCNGDNNARLIYFIPEKRIADAPGGDYKSSFSIMIAPE